MTTSCMYLVSRTVRHPKKYCIFFTYTSCYPRFRTISVEKFVNKRASKVNANFAVFSQRNFRSVGKENVIQLFGTTEPHPSSLVKVLSCFYLNNHRQTFPCEPLINVGSGFRVRANFSCAQRPFKKSARLSKTTR